MIQTLKAEALRLINPSQVHRMLGSTGWRPRGNDREGALEAWTKLVVDKVHTILVPTSAEYRDYALRLAEFIQAFAKAEGIEVAAVVQRLREEDEKIERRVGNAIEARGGVEILLVDDHKIVRDGVKAILKHHPDFRVVGEAASGQEAIQFLKRTPVELVVMDLKLQGLTGVETTSEILRYFPEIRIVMLSGYRDEDSVVASLKAGARAFVLKEAGELDLIDALRTVARGGTYLSADVSDGLLRRLQNGNLDSGMQRPLIEGLSPRELQVMRMVAEGKTSKEIAVLLDLGLQTVRGYRKTMMKKLGVNNVAELTQAALAAGITHQPESETREVRRARLGA